MVYQHFWSFMISGFDYRFLQMFLLHAFAFLSNNFFTDKIVSLLSKSFLALKKNRYLKNQKDFNFFRNFFDKKNVCAILSLHSGSDKNAMHGFHGVFLTLNLGNALL